MNKNNKAFALIEVLASVIIVSVCLTVIAQSLLNNFRATNRLQDGARSLFIIESQIDQILYLKQEVIPFGARALGAPDEKYKINLTSTIINDHLKNTRIALSWPVGQKERTFEVTTILYDSSIVTERTQYSQ